jgi:hypothetical protein
MLLINHPDAQSHRHNVKQILAADIKQNDAYAGLGTASYTCQKVLKTFHSVLSTSCLTHQFVCFFRFTKNKTMRLMHCMAWQLLDQLEKLTLLITLTLTDSDITHYYKMLWHDVMTVLTWQSFLSFSQFLSLFSLSLSLSHSRIRNLVVSQKYSQQSYRRHDRTVTGLGLSQSLNSIQSCAICNPLLNAHLRLTCRWCPAGAAAAAATFILLSNFYRSWQASTTGLGRLGGGQGRRWLDWTGLGLGPVIGQSLTTTYYTYIV